MDIKPIALKTDSGRRAANEISFMKNGVKVRDKSHLIQNEPGNEFEFNVPIGYVPIGTINISRYDTVIFSVSPSSSEIGLYNVKSKSYSTLINSSCLNFSEDYPIKALYELRNGCERIVVFWDWYNSDKLINLDDLNGYKTNGDWDCNKMQLDRNYSVPIIDNIVISEGGGSIDIGSYAFAIEILDDGLNTVYISDTSSSVPIIHDSVYGNYHSIFGSKNIDNTVAEDGGKPAANKSIQIAINNLDTAFKYFRIIVVSRTTGNGQTLEYYRDLNLYSITKEDYTYNFRGITSSFESINSQTVLIQPEKYKSSREILKIDKKLVRFNLKGERQDYASMQQLVNNITVQFITDQISPNIATEKGNSKNPNTYFDKRTFIGDEVYALGISFLDQSGNETPIFHIPGREPDSYDTALLTVVSNTTTPTDSQIKRAEVEHLNLNEGATVARWKVKNTYKLHGVLGYFDTQESYPDIVDCEGVRIYPTGNVRHHRMPDRRRIPIQTETIDGTKTLNLLGLRFNNLIYPEGVVAHKFHMVKRTDENKTVLDMGITVETRNGSTSPHDLNFYNFDFYVPSGNKTLLNPFGFISPKVLGGQFLNGNYIKYVAAYNKTGSNIIFSGEYSISGTNGEINTKNGIHTYTYGGYPPFENLSFDSSVLLAPNTTQGAIGNIDNLIINHSYSNNILVQRFKGSNDRESNKLYIVNYKNNIIPYTSFETLEYIPISKYLSSTVNTDNEIFGGDGFISQLSIFNLWDVEYDTNRIFGITIETDVNVFADYDTSIWIESEINYDLRVRGTDCNDKYIYTGDFSDTSIQDYTITRVADLNTDNEWLPKIPCQEYYNYNLDYNFYHHGRSNFILPITFDYCSKCSNLFPNRYIWSQDSLSEELQNGWLIFLSENYGIVGENTGQITGAHYDKNRLLIRTERSRFALTPNPQFIQTGDGNEAYLGTGGFLSIPASQLTKVDYGYAGGQGFLDEINTHFGLVSVDVEGRAIHIFASNGIQTITGKQFGNYQFFQEYLNTNDPYKAVQLVYDPNYTRLIVVHRVNGWIMSFDLEDMVWKSFHQYNDQYLYSNGFDLFSSQNNNIYKHLTIGNYTNFYGNKVNFEIEVQPFEYNTKDLHIVTYYAQTFDGERQLRYPTFNNLWVYTNKQSSGIVALVPKEHYKKWSNLQKTVVEAKKNYKVNAIRDILDTDADPYTGRVDQRSPINVNYKTDQSKTTFINDKYFNVRFYFNPDDDLLIIMDVIKTVEKDSIL